MREVFFAPFVIPALAALMRGIESRDDRVAALYGWKVAERAGVIPPKMVAIQQGNTAMQMPEDEAKKLILSQLLEGVLERLQIYGGKLPDDLEERHQTALEEVKKLNMQRGRA